MIHKNQKGFSAIEALIVIVVLGLIGCVGFLVAKKTLLKPVQVESQISSSSPDTTPELTYPGAYNGKLYLTGEKVGESAPWKIWAQNLQRNGISNAIAYFGIEVGNSLISSGDTDVIINAVKEQPGRLIPFISTGVGGEEESEMAGDKLTEKYKKGYQALGKAAGSNFVRGFGEVELQDWDMPHNDPKVLQLFSLAADNNLNVMFHVRPGESKAVGDIAKRYPKTIFLIHMFTNDFDKESQAIIEVMKQHDNVYYTIDADHLLFDNSGNRPIGLLYKYQDNLDDDLDPSADSVRQAATQFNTDFDKLEPTLRADAARRFKPLVEAVPNQVTVGTELNLPYGYEPGSYDRIIKHLRYFVGGFDEQIQAKLAYKNAEKAFGYGVSVK